MIAHLPSEGVNLAGFDSLHDHCYDEKGYRHATTESL